MRPVQDAKHIMVVDDELGTVKLVGIMLEREGFVVLKAKDAFEALDLLEKTDPDLFILDVKMPGMNGFELCQLIRARLQTARTPVLMISAAHDAENINRLVKSRADDYLPKPFLHWDLLAKVHTLMGMQEGTRNEQRVPERGGG
jgi:two-component system sensor histidine kinase/response regulator